MSIFSELMKKINDISYGYDESMKDDLQCALDALNQFGDDFVNSKSKTRDLNHKNKNATITLQSINEDEDEPAKAPETEATARRSTKRSTDSKSSKEELKDVSTDKRQSKKRSKDKVEGMSSPQNDKRPKRNASVKAQGVISKQVNVNLSLKMRREEEKEPTDKRSSRRKGRQESDKENAAPVVQVKQEKVSIPPEVSMDFETANIPLKQETNMDQIAMPPPAVPVPKPRGRPAKQKEPSRDEESDDESGGTRRAGRGRNHAEQPPPTEPRGRPAKQKELSRDEESDDESGGTRRAGRGRKNTEQPPPPPVAAPRSTRASSRNNTFASSAGEPIPPPPREARPKRTRGKKKVSEPQESSQESAPSSPIEKPRPKRTRRGQKAAEKERLEAEKALEDAKQTEETAKTKEPVISPKDERCSIPEPAVSSPILQKEPKLPKDKEIKSKTADEAAISLEETRVIASDVTVDICNGAMDKTVILPNGMYDHAPMTPKKKIIMNETVVIDKINRETMVLGLQPPAKPLDATVVLDKEPQPTNMTDDNSLMTDDESNGDGDYTPPRNEMSKQPVSAVKEKVQQFEEMATRVTRTKTRAIAKKEEQEDNQTPPDKVCKVVLSADTLSKMNSLIFNGKPNAQISSSASKPRANILTTVKSLLPATTGKMAAMARHKETAEESLKREKEDARKKKEALLDAKKESQKRKREEKMAAAAATREAAERERQLQLEAAARERQEKQAHADKGKLDRQKEAERKKHELARKVAETEERRRAEERARQARLADEQRRADTQRKRQHDEQEAMKIEAAVMAKEIEKRQKEYIEKQKLKQKMEADKTHTPRRTPGTPGQAAPALLPVHMRDGFEQLNSDEDEDAPTKHPVPAWSTHKVRWQQLTLQAQIKQSHIDRLFSVRVHTPDLRQIFPEIDRRALKRTSSAVWRTPPRLPALAE